MGRTKVFAGFSLCAALVLSSMPSSWAGEPIFFITHNGQDALLLGTVVAVNPDSITFQPALSISGKHLHSPIIIRHVNPSTESGNSKPALGQGDRLLVSVNAEGNAYRLASGASKVSSLNPEILKILESDFLFDHRFMLQWYVNSCGQAADFLGDGSTVLIRQSDGTQVPIARKKNKTWVPLRKASFYHQACNQLRFANQVSSMLPWLGTAIAGLGVVCLAYRLLKSPRKSSKI
jgi:hypothetical protein